MQKVVPKILPPEVLTDNSLAELAHYKWRKGRIERQKNTFLFTLKNAFTNINICKKVYIV